MKYLIFVTVLVAASAASADILFGAQSNPDVITGGTGCSTDFTLADDFTLEPAGGGTVETIDWWLTGTECGIASSAWILTFFTDEPGSPFNVPGDTLWQKSLYPDISFVGYTGDSLMVWNATFSLDPSDYVTLDGSTVYWAGIHYTGTEYSVFAADVYPGSGGHYCFFYPGQPWYGYDGDMVFGLSGTVGSSALERNTWGAIKMSF